MEKQKELKRKKAIYNTAAAHTSLSLQFFPLLSFFVLGFFFFTERNPAIKDSEDLLSAISMPAQKRYWHDERRRREEAESSLNHTNGKRSRYGDGEVERRRENRRDREQERRREEEEEVEEEEEGEQEEMEAAENQENGYDSEGNQSRTSGEEPELIVQLPAIRKDVQCPICLGIIKRTRTVMECLHRFCKECIDKSMRLGNNECPACRTHCASRRSLRDDPKYDNLIAALFPDIDRYEEEELAFHDEERNLNKQFQASIAEISRKQNEALNKKHQPSKDKDAGPVMPRSQHNPGTGTRTRRNSRGRAHQVSEDNEDEFNDDGVRDSSSTDQHREVRPRRRKRRPGTRLPHPSSSAANSAAGGTENDIEQGRRENRGVSPGLMLSPDAFVWARASARSHTRHGNKNHPRNGRIAKIVEHLKKLEEHNDESDVHLTLVSLDNRSTHSLKQPYLCCRSTLSVGQLCEYVSHQTPLQAEEVEILMVKEQLGANGSLSNLDTSADKLQTLDFQDTLAGLKVNDDSAVGGHLILAYRQKPTIIEID